MNSDPRRTDHPDSRPSPFVIAMPQIGALLLLFASAAVFEAKKLFSLSALSNDGIWGHLRTGLWILQTHGVPHSGLFSQSPQLPWSAPSWGYDLLVGFSFRLLGLRSIPVLLMVFKLALAVVTFLLAGGVRGRLWPALALSATAQYILDSVQLCPGYCSMILFAVELLLLYESRTTGNFRPLVWLLPLFLVWANLDIQFVYGILMLALFLAVSLLQDLGSHLVGRGSRPAGAALRLANAGIVAILCGIATIITPYFYHLYGVFLASLTSPGNRYLADFHAMGFRQPRDYVLMLLTMAAFLALGLRRSRDSFQIALLSGCAMLSFYAQREAWLAAMAAVAVIAEAIRDTGGTSETDAADVHLKRVRNRHLLIAGGLAVALLVLAAGLEIPSSGVLLAKVAQSYPVAACDYIRRQHLPPPLFNSYEWGGFLTWYLPEYPVAIDDRIDLYDENLIIQYFKVMNAELPYQAYPPMAQAGTLLLRRNSPMGEALRTLPAFRVAYSDNVALVLTKP